MGWYRMEGIQMESDSTNAPQTFLVGKFRFERTEHCRIGAKSFSIKYVAPVGEDKLIVSIFRVGEAGEDCTHNIRATVGHPRGPYSRKPNDEEAAAVPLLLAVPMVEVKTLESDSARIWFEVEGK